MAARTALCTVREVGLRASAPPSTQWLCADPPPPPATGLSPHGCAGREGAHCGGDGPSLSPPRTREMGVHGRHPSRASDHGVMRVPYSHTCEPRCLTFGLGRPVRFALPQDPSRMGSLVIRAALQRRPDGAAPTSNEPLLTRGITWFDAARHPCPASFVVDIYRSASRGSGGGNAGRRTRSKRRLESKARPAKEAVSTARPAGTLCTSGGRLQHTGAFMPVPARPAAPGRVAGLEQVAHRLMAFSEGDRDRGGGEASAVLGCVFGHGCSAHSTAACSHREGTGAWVRYVGAQRAHLVHATQRLARLWEVRKERKRP